jgi:hypothetical protein
VGPGEDDEQFLDEEFRRAEGQADAARTNLMEAIREDLGVDPPSRDE